MDFEIVEFEDKHKYIIVCIINIFWIIYMRVGISICLGNVDKMNNILTFVLLY